MIFGLTVLGVLIWIPYVVAFPIAIDAHAYYAVDPVHPYGAAVGSPDAYFYSPVFAELTAPLRGLDWDAFRTLWRSFEVASLALLAGPLTGPALFVPPVAFEVNLANIHLLLALAMVLGFRWPGLWAFVLLTKVTPGVGLLWFVVRREWRSLAVAVATTGVIVLISLPFGPSLWVDWVRTIAAAEPPPPSELVLPVPLVVRVMVAAAIVATGARFDQRWTVVLAGFIALPVTWEFAESILVGMLAAVVIGTRAAPLSLAARLATRPKATVSPAVQ